MEQVEVYSIEPNQLKKLIWKDRWLPHIPVSNRFAEAQKRGVRFFRDIKSAPVDRHTFRDAATLSNMDTLTAAPVQNVSILDASQGPIEFIGLTNTALVAFYLVAL